jgi:hypothetical protein
VLVVALSDPSARLRGRDHVLLPKRRPCQGCGALLSAYAAPSDRFCLCCAPLVEQEPRRDPALWSGRTSDTAGAEALTAWQGYATELRALCQRVIDEADEATASAFFFFLIETAVRHSRRAGGAP